MIYTKEVENMCPVAKGAKHEPAPIPEEGKWVHSKKIEDISGFTHGVGWCAPQQGACKLSLNVKNGIIEEALVETIGCSGMTHSAAMAAEIQLSIKDAEAALKAFIDVVSADIKKGEKVQLVGFGTFEVVERKEREGRNPQSGETMKIAASKAPKFKAGKALKDAVNE